MSTLIDTLSPSNISSSFQLTCIKQVSDYSRSTYSNNAIYVSDANSATYDTTTQSNLVMVGNTNTADGSLDDIVILGNSVTAKNSDNTIIIGNDSSCISDNDAAPNDSNILVGNSTKIIGNDSDENVILGSDLGDVQGTRSVVISCPDTGYGNNVSNSVLILNGSLPGGGQKPTNGSVVLSSGGNVASLLPRVQFLSENLTRLQGANVATKYDPAVTSPTPAAINGYMRIRYHGFNLLVPVLADPDDLANAPAY